MVNRVSNIGIGFVLLLTFCLYLFPISQSEFLNWDDPLYLTGNEWILTDQALSAIWIENKIPNPYPLTFTVLHFQWKFFGLHSFFFHLTNLLLHLLNIFLWFKLLKKFKLNGISLWLPLFLYAIHPVQVETVMWISEIKNLLSAFFYWLSFLLFLNYFETSNRRAYFYAGTFFFVVSLLSKSMTITLPVSLTLWSFIFYRHQFMQHLLRLLPLWCISVVFGLLSMASEGQYYYYRHEQILQRTGIERFFNGVESLYFYLGKFVYPGSLSCVYPQTLFGFPSPVWKLFFVLALLLLIAILFELARRLPQHSKLAIFCILNYGILASPILGFFSTTYLPLSKVADRYNYHPLPFLALLFALLLSGFIEKFSLRIKNFVYFFLAGWVLFLCCLMIQQALIWSQSLTLWTQAVRVNPEEAEVHYNLGSTYLEKGDRFRAKQCFEQALRRDPDHYASNNNYGNILVQEEKPFEAVPYFERAIQIYPPLWRAHSSLAQIYQKKGDPLKAIVHYKKALVAEDPHFLKNTILPKLAQLLLEQRFIEEALFYFQEIERYHGDPVVVAHGIDLCFREKMFLSILAQSRNGFFPEAIQSLHRSIQDASFTEDRFQNYWNLLRCGIEVD